MDKSKEEFIEEKLNSTYEELDNFLSGQLKLSYDKIDKMNNDDFYKLLAICMEEKYTVEDQTDELAKAFGYKLKVIDEISKRDFQKNMTNEDIKDMLMDNVVGLYFAYSITWGIIMRTSTNPYEAIKKMLISFGIVYFTFLINKKYFLSNFHKEVSKTAVTMFKDELTKTEEKIKILETYKKYTTKEYEYAMKKLEEIAPKMKDNETFDEYLRRIFSNMEDIDKEELSFLNTKKKTRKR